MAYPSKARRNAEILAARRLPADRRPTLAALGAKHGVSRERVRQIAQREQKRTRLETSSRRIVVLGGPGVGKSTQGASLAAALQVPWLSAGDLIRGAGRRLPRGKHGLADTEATVALIAQAWAPNDGAGLVLDGFPRSADQVPHALALLGPSMQAVVLTLDPGEATRRMRERARAGEDDSARRTGRILEHAWRQADLLTALRDAGVALHVLPAEGTREAVLQRILDTLAATG